MAFTKLIYHIVFRPLGNAPVIAEEHERDLYMYIYGFCNNHQCVLYRIGGMPDHIHMCVGLHPTTAVATFIHDLKIAAGNFMRSRCDLFPMFDKLRGIYKCGATLSGSIFLTTSVSAGRSDLRLLRVDAFSVA